MKYIFKNFNFHVFNYKDMEALLNNMAQKGYEFKGTGVGWIKDVAMFEKSERAKELKYAVDVRGELTLEERGSYYNFYRDLGWKNEAIYKKKMHIFVSQGGAVPLYSDSVTEIENFIEAAPIREQMVKCFLIMAFYAVLTKGIISLGDYVSNRVLAYGILVICVGLFLHSVIACIDCLWYGRKCRRSIVEGTPMPHNSLLCELQLYERIFTIALFPGLYFLSLYAFSVILKTGAVGYDPAFVWALLCAQSVSVPLIFITTYLLFRKPESGGLKAINFIGAFLYLFCFYSANNMWSYM